MHEKSSHSHTPPFAPKPDGTRSAQSYRGDPCDRPQKGRKQWGEYKIRPYQRYRAVSQCYAFWFSGERIPFVWVAAILSASVAVSIAIVWVASLFPAYLSVLAICLVPLVLWMLVWFRRSIFGHDLTLPQSFGAFLIAAGTATITFNGLRAGPGMTIADVFMLVGAFLLVPSLLVDRSVSLRVPLWLLVATCFLLLGGFFAAIGTTEDIISDSTVTMQFAAALLGTPLVIGIMANSLPRVLLITNLWVMFTAIGGAIGYLDLAGITSIGPTLTGIDRFTQGRVIGLTTHPNHLALTCAMALPVTVFFVSSANNLLKRSFYILLLASLSFGVLASGSRAGLVAGATGVILLLLFQRHFLKNVLLVIGMGTAVILLVSLYTNLDSEQIFVGIQRLTEADSSVADSNMARMASYQEALSSFAAKPLVGQGFSHIRDAHNIGLQLLQGGGLVAFSAFSLFVLGVFRLGWRLAYEPLLSDDMRNLTWALMVSLLVWLLDGLVQPAIYDRYLYVPAALLFAIELSIVKRCSVSQTRRQFYYPT